MDIKKDDVYYQTNDVCILKPEVKKGVLIKHCYGESDISFIKMHGLKSGSRSQADRVDVGRTVTHRSIFFCAPYMYTPQIDRSSIENEIIASYGDIGKKCIYLRVDPANTQVFSSEIRTNYISYVSPETRTSIELSRIETEIKNSRKLMTEYFEIIEQNSNLIQPQAGYVPMWHLFSSRKQWFPPTMNPGYPWNGSAIERNSEVLIGPKDFPFGTGICLPFESFAYIT